jgi:RHO1 GDP-GTP exchange protein 1/2
MADYGSQQGRNYGPGARGARDDAFSSIFGAAPPPGRSQTMTSQPPPPGPPRAQTMTSGPAGGPMQRQPPMRAPGGPMMNGQPGGPNGYQGPPRPNGPPQSQPQPQYLPQPLYPDRRPYPQAQRIDPRQGPPQQYQQRAIPNRAYQNGPAMNADPYRSRSMAGPGHPPFNGPPPPNGYYQGGGGPGGFRAPPFPTTARTTAQGRMIPERQDERAMSMTSYTNERDHSQTMSGRVIPNRRRESGNSESYDQNSPNRPPPNNTISPIQKARNPSMGTATPSFSMTSTVVPPSSTTTRTSTMTSDATLAHRPSVAKSANSSASTVLTTQRRAPLVYPALLSRVANTFRERIGVGDRTKNELTYKNAFTGQEAVDLISYIIKTTDRNLALLLGRALDAQKFFHDVTYDHRLRDSNAEVFQFRDTGMAEEEAEVNGVFTLLTECYSPTCTPDRLCYSIACPRRLEQQARLNLKPTGGLKTQSSRASLHGDDDNEQKLWINTVSKEVADSVDDREKKRQEVISEIMYTERDFVKDLEYLRDFWMQPLRSSNPERPSPIPEYRREKFIRTVFSNVLDVHSVNSRMSESLNRRQQQNSVVRNVGDIFLEYVPRFEPFIKYGANQLYGKYEFEKERSANPAFSRFVDETERRKESRKLELNGYLTKPTTRLARYPLLLENVAKYTADDNPDKADIPKAVVLIREFLTRVNIESGKAENLFNLLQLNEQLKFKAGEYVDLKLTEESRQLLFKGALKKTPTDNSDIQAFLFDHAVLLVRIKVVNKRDELKVYRKVSISN